MFEDIEVKPKFTLMYGIAEKSLAEMTDSEQKIAFSKAYVRAKEAAFSRGLPIIIGKNGLVIAEYSNGQKFVRENGKNIRLYNE